MKKFQITILGLVVLALAACLDEDTLNGPGPDKSAPTVTAVTPIDAYHVDMTFGEPLDVYMDGRNDLFTMLNVATPPGSPVTITRVRLSGDGKTMTISTASSMAGLLHRVTVSSMVDHSGNVMRTPVVKAFTGSSVADQTAPQVVYQLPLPGQSNVVLSHRVNLKFSEGVTTGSVSSGASWTTDQGAVAFTVSESLGLVLLTPSGNLASNTAHTVKLTGIQDAAGNVMPDVEWSFTTQP